MSEEDATRAETQRRALVDALGVAVPDMTFEAAVEAVRSLRAEVAKRWSERQIHEAVTRAAESERPDITRPCAACSAANTDHCGDCSCCRGIALEWPKVVCTQYIGGSTPIGWVCPSCGHHGLAHPGGHNPRLASCVLCELMKIGNLL